jgi:hypothetical protein
VSAAAASAAPRVAGTEVAKLRAFIRRDFLIAWSYRVAFVSDLAGLGIQMVLFAYIGKIVAEGQLPTYGSV